MGNSVRLHLGTVSCVKMASKSLKKPHLWFGFQQCCCSQKANDCFLAAVPKNEREGKGLGEEEKQTLCDNRTDGNNSHCN